MGSIFDLVVDSGDGVFGADDDQRIVFWNRAAERILDLPAKEVLGRPCYEVIGGRNEELCLKCQRDCSTIRLAREGRSVPARDLWLRLSGDREMWLSVSTIRVPSRWRHLSVLIHIFHEISRQKRIERSVMALLSQVEGFVGKDPSWRNDAVDAPGTNGKLSGREREVLGLLASGASTADVAGILFISPSTVRNHVHNVLAKLGVHTRLEAVAVALRNGLIPATHLRSAS